MMNNTYESPLCSRYAGEKMQYIFSPNFKFRTFRKLWIALARAQKTLGLDVTDEQISEMEKFCDDINYDAARKYEKKLRHDVMAHIHAYGDQCPHAKPIIHLGATSCYVTDNTDIIQMRQGLLVLRAKLLKVISFLSDFAITYKDQPTLSYTHLQPAQLTTVGKRATLWINEILMDFEEINFRLSSLKLLGSKGTTGTQASFVELFDGDVTKIDQLEKMIAAEMGFDDVLPVSGQTYPRKIDSAVLSALSGIAQSASKFANDIRILQSFKEMEEPFEESQIGSSAMPYKRNPMRCERISALSRYVIVDSLNPALTSSVQWFERTLDDSANKRIAVAEAFLAADAILNIYMDVAKGLVVYPNVINARILNELPFMATENILMSAVKKGGDRQALHEKIRVHSQKAGRRVKEEGLENDLVERISADPAFGLNKNEIEKMLVPSNFIGCAPLQTERYIKNIVRPVLEAYAKEIEKAEIPSLNV